MTLQEYSHAAVHTHYCGLLDQECEYCHSYNFAGERIGNPETGHVAICCGNGKYNRFASFERPPPELENILCGNTFRDRQARDLLKTYNNAKFPI